MTLLRYSGIILIILLQIFAMSCRLKKNSLNLSENHSTEQRVNVDSQLIDKNLLSDFLPELVKIKSIDYDTVLFASLLKTVCYGKCPSFEIRCYESGFITYEGFANTILIGKYETRIDSNYKSEIRKNITKYKFLEMEDKYPVSGKTISDFPITISGYFEKGIKKVIYNRHDAPQELLFYERFFVDFFENLEWKPNQR